MNKAFVFIALVMLSLTAYAVPTINSFTIASGANYTNSETPTLNIDATDANYMAFSCNDATYTADENYASTKTNFNIADGNNGCATGDGEKTVHVRLKDADDSNSTATSSDTIILDTAKPSTSWDGNNYVWQNFDANIHLTCTDSNSGCASTSYRLDTNPAAGNDWGSLQTYTTNVLLSSDGNYGLDFNSTDNAGNEGDSNVFFVLIDKTIPSVSNKNPTGTTSDSTPTISFDVNDSGIGLDLNADTLSVSIDGNSIAFASLTVSSAGTGAHIEYTLDYNIADKIVDVNITVEDKLGNSTTSSWTFTVSTTTPVANSITISSPSNAVSGYINDSTPSLDLNADGATVMYFSCNDSNYSSAITYASSYASFDLKTGAGCTDSDGSKTLYFKAGNSDTNSGSINASVVLDTNSPASAITSHTDLAKLETSGITLAYYVVDGGGSGLQKVEVWKDSESPETFTLSGESEQTGTKIFDSLSDGNHTFSVRAYDRSGNTGITTITLDITVPSGGSDGGDTDTGGSSGGGGGGSTDTSPPSLEWIDLKDGDIIKGTVTLKVQSNDPNSKVATVVFNIGPDNALIAILHEKAGSGYFEAEFDTTQYDDAEWSVKATSRSAGGSVSKTLNLKINNHGTFAEEQVSIERTSAPAEEETLQELETTEEEAEVSPATALVIIPEILEIPIQNAPLVVILIALAALMADLLMYAGIKLGKWELEHPNAWGFKMPKIGKQAEKKEGKKEEKIEDKKKGEDDIFRRKPEDFKSDWLKG